MTLNKCLTNLEFLKINCTDDVMEEAIDMAIRSLEAWGAVKREINLKWMNIAERMDIKDPYNFHIAQAHDEAWAHGLSDAMHIINKYLSEVEGGECG